MHSGCEQCCNNNNNDVFVDKLDIIYSNDKKSTWKFEFKDIIYKCNKCNYYWFYKYWEDETDDEWMIETNNFETPKICSILVPITEKEFNLIIKDNINNIPFRMFQNREHFNPTSKNIFRRKNLGTHREGIYSFPSSNVIFLFVDLEKSKKN